MRKLSERRKTRIALDWLTGRKSVSQLMREVYGATNRPHIYVVIAHGLKAHYEKQQHHD